MELTLTRAEARKVVMASGSGAGLARPFEGDGAEGALAAIRAVGYAQIDTISVLRRAHDHVLWSRAPLWRSELMTGLETSPRRVVEYWAHAAAYIPLEDWRYCLPRMRRIAREGHEWFRCEASVAAETLARIRDEGALASRHFGDETSKPRSWWGWKPAKAALEYLFQSGELVCVTRDGFQKRYDLAERHIPAELREAPMPDDGEMAAWYLDRAAASLGAFAETDVAYQRRDGKAGIARELGRRLETGELSRIRIAGEGKASPLYAAPPSLERALSALPNDECRVRLLSPFDPLVIQRKRAKRIFGLDYTIECYTPEAKRVFGYFALPVLFLGGEDARFVGLVDGAMDRKNAALELRRVRIDAPSGGESRARLLDALSAELRAFAAFNGAERVTALRVESDDGNFARGVKAKMTMKRISGPGTRAATR